MNSVEVLKKWAEVQGWTYLSEYKPALLIRLMLGIKTNLQFMKPDGYLCKFHIHHSGEMCRQDTSDLVLRGRIAEQRRVPNGN